MANGTAKRADGKADMSVSVAGVALRNPVIAASGTFGYGIEFQDILSLDRIGAFVTKGLSRTPMDGNRAPRIIETASGMINAIGLQNVGVDAFVREKMPSIRKLRGVVCIANVFGFTVDDCVAVIERLNEADGIAMYELNASCPNTKHGGMIFGTDEAALRELVERCRNATDRPLMVKLSPNVTSIAQMAKAAESAGADAISLVNTFVSLAIDVETRRPRIANVTGGLSGPAIKPIAVRMVWEASQAVTHSGRRHGRHLARGGRGRVPAGRRHRRRGGHCQLRRSASRREGRKRPGKMVRVARCQARRRTDRCLTTWVNG